MAEDGPVLLTLLKLDGLYAAAVFGLQQLLLEVHFQQLAEVLRVENKE